MIAGDGAEGGGTDRRAVTVWRLDQTALTLGAQPLAVAADHMHGHLSTPWRTRTWQAATVTSTALADQPQRHRVGVAVDLDRAVVAHPPLESAADAERRTIRNAGARQPHHARSADLQLAARRRLEADGGARLRENSSRSARAHVAQSSGSRRRSSSAPRRVSEASTSNSSRRRTGAIARAIPFRP